LPQPSVEFRGGGMIAAALRGPFKKQGGSPLNKLGRPGPLVASAPSFLASGGSFLFRHPIFLAAPRADFLGRAHSVIFIKNLGAVFKSI